MVSTAGGIVIAIVVILVAAAVGWVVFSQLRARRLGVSLCSFPSCYFPLFLRRRIATTDKQSFRERRQHNIKAATVY